jgi:hypothetical protein
MADVAQDTDMKTEPAHRKLWLHDAEKCSQELVDARVRAEYP